MKSTMQTVQLRREQYVLDIGKLTLKSLYQLRDDLNKYCVTLPFFGFNSSSYDLNLLDILLYQKKCSSSVIRQANQFLGMSFLELQFLDILNFLGGATGLDQFLKAYGSEEQKGLSHMNGLIVLKN